MRAKLPRMPMRRVHISDDDLETIAQACSRMATGYRADAKRQPNPSTKIMYEELALKHERIAERMKRFLET